MSKLTKEQRATRETNLITAIFNGLVATVEKQAKLWALRARDLRKGLRARAIKRAERRANAEADERPPGYVKAMEAMDLVEEMRERYGISKRDADAIWGAVAQFCMYQLGARTGPFYDAARYFGLMPSKDGGHEVPRVMVDRAPIEVVRVRTPGCNCANCRPRTEQELN